MRDVCLLVARCSLMGLLPEHSYELERQLSAVSYQRTMSH